MTTGERIKLFRERRDLTQKDLAALVGVHQTKISQVETGERGISLDLAAKIATALGVSIDDLVPTVTPELAIDLNAMPQDPVLALPHDPWR